jgi:superfamily II DNA or RNA helicase
MRILSYWDAELRNWQSRAFDDTLTEFMRGAKNYLCEATPGSGKTRYALRFAHRLLTGNHIKFFIVLVHTDHLKRQWAIDADKYGIDLDPDFVVMNGYHGIVITYQALANQLIRTRQIVDSIPTLIISDEIHHAGENLTWGNALNNAFENAIFKLSLSGTPFREDNHRIPFVKYVDGISHANFTYGYAEALTDGVCRPIYFPAYDGIMEWKTDRIRYIHSFTDILNDEKSSERLRTALSARGDWMRHIITDADIKLNEIRKTHSDAGGLVFAIDQKHARKIALLIREVTDGEMVSVAISDDKESSDVIEMHSRGNRKWLVCVKMVSEGVDISRLRVGVYATNVKSEKFFRQVVGRFVRIIKGLPEQNAYLYIPKDVELLEYAYQIETAREHVLSERKRFVQINSFIEEQKKDPKEYEAISAHVTEKTQVQLSLFGSRVAGAFGLPANLANQISSNTRAMVIASADPSFKQLAAFQKEAALRDDITGLSRQLARKWAGCNAVIVDWDKPHREWIANGGKPIEQETIIELKKRKIWLRGQL